MMDGANGITAEAGTTLEDGENEITSTSGTTSEEGENEITSTSGTTSEEGENEITAASTSSDEVKPVYTHPKTKLMIAVSQSNVHGYPLMSNTSKAAFGWTMENIIGNIYNQHKIFLIHVQVPQSWIRKLLSLVCSYIRDCWFFGMGGSPRSAESPRNHEEEVLEFMDYFEKQCREKNIEYESLLKTGCPKKVICDEVKNVKPDLLVLGNRGLSDIQRLFRPNVSTYCAKYAECEVVTRVKRPRALIRSHKGIHLD